MEKRLPIILLVLCVVLASTMWATGGREPDAAETGGIVKIGTQPVSNLDPHLATSIADILLLEQLYHHLTYIDAENRPVPDLATEWQSPDAGTWTFTLRDDVVFSDGRPLTADDVVFSFDRLRDPDFGSPAISIFGGIEEVEAVGEHQVRFTLAAPNPEFPADVGAYHASILPKGTIDPAGERVASGPFMIEEYYPEDRVILVRNPYFRGEDTDGNPLPYLDELHLIFSPELGGQVEALRGGELQFVGGLTTEFARVVDDGLDTKIISNETNMHWVIHMRSDDGHVASDNRIRRALKLATDQREMIDAVRPGLASVGNGYTPVGPAYGDYYLDRPPVQDLEEAKRLLAEAGYPTGLEITLHAQNQLDVVPIATVWKEQLARIGVEVDIQVIPSDVYYGEGPQSWLEADFGITDWGSRATPITYFKVGYWGDSQWNESHWSDPEFDTLVTRIDSEVDRDARIDLYRQAQEILIERGPVIVAYFVNVVAGLAGNLEGVELASDWARTRFWNARFRR